MECIQRMVSAIIKLEFIEYYNDLVRIAPGNLIAEGQIHNYMIIQMQTHHHPNISFVQMDFIVLTLFVHLVVLSLPGQSLTEENHQQEF